MTHEHFHFVKLNLDSLVWTWRCQREMTVGSMVPWKHKGHNTMALMSLSIQVAACIVMVAATAGSPSGLKRDIDGTSCWDTYHCDSDPFNSIQVVGRSIFLGINGIKNRNVYNLENNTIYKQTHP